MSDPKVAAIPVANCDEPLLDVRACSGLLVDERKQDGTGAPSRACGPAFWTLLDAQAALPDGLRLLFVEGFRPPALQSRYFDEYAAELRAANPDWSDDRIRSAASRYVSPPEIAPHSAGAAVDLTLADADGRELDLGTRVNANPEESAGACYPCREHRRAGPRQPAAAQRRPDRRRPRQLPHRVVALVVRGPLLGAGHRRAVRALRTGAPVTGSRHDTRRAEPCRSGPWPRAKMASTPAQARGAER